MDETDSDTGRPHQRRALRDAFHRWRPRDAARRRAWRVGVVAGGLSVCAVAGAGVGLAAFRAPAPAGTIASLRGVGPATARGTDASGPGASRDGCGERCAPVAAGPPAPPLVGAPTRIRIRRIGVDARLLALRLDRAGELVAPVDFTRAGWYADGPAPGDTGPAVIAGHLDSRTGPAVFARLPELAPGDLIEVLRGVDWVPFTVTTTSRVAKERFPTSQVYDPTPGPELRLVTCGGAFDRSRRHYRDNVIVFAVSDRPVEILPRSAAG